MIKEIVCESCGRVFIGYHNSRFCELCCQKRAKIASAETWERTKLLREEQRKKSVIVTYDAQGFLFFVAEKEKYESELKKEAVKMYKSSQWGISDDVQKSIVAAVCDDSDELPVFYACREGEATLDTIYLKRVKIGDFFFQDIKKKKKQKKKRKKEKYKTT